MELRLTSILASSEKLASSLERRLTLPESPPTPGSYVTAARAARRICELGKGGDAARKLVASCFNAVLHKDGDARGDRNTARNVLCTWLPYGYPEVARTTVLRLSGRPPDPRNLEAATCREQFVEVFMAHLDGRECKFTKAVVDQFGSHSIAQSMFFAPPGASERQSPDQIAEILVKAFRSRYAVDSVTSLQSRIFVESEKGDTPYLLVRAAMRPLAMPDAALARLNETFEELRIIVLPDAPTPSDNEKSESILWTRLIDLLAD